MSEREDILNELKDIAPELAKFKEEQSGTGFEVPPRYFNDLKQVLMQEIEAEVGHSKGKGQANWWQGVVAGLQSLLQPRPALAFATIALLIAAGLWFSQSQDSLQQVGTDMALNDEDVEAYVMANIEEFDTDILIDMYAETFQEESEDPVTEDNLEEILQEMDDEDFEELWESESFNE
ncbi:MAG: hypothetical protein KTR30_23180 [Saprospiraceae bacterium]|nr:hypothetical protein [Saprospiraceae bacterium]